MYLFICSKIPLKSMKLVPTSAKSAASLEKSVKLLSAMYVDHFEMFSMNFKLYAFHGKLFCKLF